MCSREVLSALASPSKEEEEGGDELRTGLVDPFGARIFQTKYPKCREREEPTGKDSNRELVRTERVDCGRATTYHNGTGAAALEHADKHIVSFSFISSCFS